VRREAPETGEGWYALHDLRAVDWDAWRSATERERERAIREGEAFLREAADGEAESAAFSVVGEDGDLLFVHLRPELETLNAVERAFEHTALAAFTERTGSYVSVTEVSTYNADAADPEEIDDPGLARYVGMRLEPSIPDADWVSFYPMDKRRGESDNWYDLPFEERAEMMESHGEIGREYGGKVTQIVTGSIGIDDWEWGVTLFANDLTQVKKLLYEMRFDRSSSRYAEFGPFYVGRRIAAGDLAALLAGDPVPTDAGVEEDGVPSVGRASAESGRAHHGGDGHHGDHDESEGGDGGPPAHVDAGDGGGPPEGVTTGGASDEAGGEDLRSELADLDVYAGQPSGEDVHAVVVYSEADPETLFEEASGLRSNFDHYDTHVSTSVYAPVEDGEETAVASVWETASAADTAAGFLADLPGVVRQAGDGGETWGTMGMFYTVKPEHRRDFVEKFEVVGDLLGEMDGHHHTDLLANREDENDMFIASRWASREDAMAFFRSDEFRDTVQWGRDVLADRPRHVFLA
jgi:chlorite dismutase